MTTSTIARTAELLSRAPPQLRGAAVAQLARLVEAKLAARKAAKPKRVTLMEHLREVDPGPYLDWWHVGLLAEQVQRVLDGEVHRLLICAPPRMYKSRPVVQGGGSCQIRNVPESKVFAACSDRDLVYFHSRHTRDHVLQSGVGLRPDSKSVSLWETEQGGAYKAVTVNAGKLGFGWDTGIVDDPFASRAEALNARVQNEVWEWYRDHFMSRAQPRPDGSPPCHIVIQQRLASGDLAGKLLDHLEKASNEEWEALVLQGYKKPLTYSFPACMRRIEDPRQDGEPLCEDPETMVQVDERRETNPWLARAVDDQDPAEEVSGGIFCGAWFRRRASPDLLSRVGRGWDLSAGGSDALASAKGGPLLGGRFRWTDCTEDYPPAASIRSIIFGYAEDDGRGVEIVLPSEPATGRNYVEDLAKDLRQAGYTVHLAPQRGPKRQRALPHASAAAAHCGACQRLIVPVEARELFVTLGVCRCERPDGDGRGKVELAMAPGKTELFASRHNAFTGLPGGADDLVDAAAIAYNAMSSAPARAGRREMPGVMLG